MTAAGRRLAGRYKRGDRAEAWLLPDDTPDLILSCAQSFASGTSWRTTGSPLRVTQNVPG
jgi:hypothetical protein